MNLDPATSTALSPELSEDARALYEFHAMDSGPVTADLMLVAGSHDLRVADQAAALWHDGAAPLIVCSGGGGKVTAHEWDRSEGELFVERCVSLGVPPESLIAENRATNTGDNFTLSRDLLANDRPDVLEGVNSGIIVSKTYMARRAWATGAKQWPLPQWFVRPPAISFDDYPTQDTPLDRMLNLMVGDLQRLEVYAVKGFQVPVEIPAPIWSAYERLRDAGYDQFVIKDE